MVKPPRVKDTLGGFFVCWGRLYHTGPCHETGGLVIVLAATSNAITR